MLMMLAAGLIFGSIALFLLASPWPFLAPLVVFGMAALGVLYRRPALGLLGLAALVPFEGVFKGMEFSGAKLLGASVIGVLLLQLLLRQIPRERLQSNLWPLLLLFLLWVFFSLLFTENLGLSLGNLRELLIGMTLFGIALLLGRDLSLLMLCRVVAFCVALTCVIALVSSKHQVGGRAIGLLQDANYFALLIALALPLSTLLALHAKGLLVRLLWIGISVLLLAGLTKTDSRSGLVVLLLTAGIGFWHHRARLAKIRPQHLGFVMLGIAILAPLALSSLPDHYVERITSLGLLKSGVNAHQDASLGRRASYLVVGGEMIGDNPLVGAGPGTFPIYYANTGYAKAFSVGLETPELFRRAHNTYLEIFAEMGIPAGLLFIALLCLGLRNYERARLAWLRNDNQIQADIATHLGLGLLTMMLFMLFLSVPNHKLLWLLLGLSWVLRQQAESVLVERECTV